MKNILLVDDDHSTISTLTEWLENVDHFHVTNISKADDVFEFLIKSHFDAIILDIMMPIPEIWTDVDKANAQNGLATGKILFQIIRNKLPEIPILIYSARDVPFELDIFTKAIRKPESLLIITKQLKELLKYES
jgi:CheY-like chemotaxis protein